jgi:hypothetical protein
VAVPWCAASLGQIPAAYPHYSSVLSIELYEDPGSNLSHYVRVVYNNTVLPVPWCANTPRFGDGLCAASNFTVALRQYTQSCPPPV